MQPILFITDWWGSVPTKNLSFSTGFNYQKIIVDDVKTVTIASFTGNLETLFTITTGATSTPTARLFTEYQGVMAPAISSFTAFGIGIYGINVTLFAGFDTSNNLLVQALNLEFIDIPDFKIYSRLYLDGRP